MILPSRSEAHIAQVVLEATNQAVACCCLIMVDCLGPGAPGTNEISQAPSFMQCL